MEKQLLADMLEKMLMLVNVFRALTACREEHEEEFTEEGSKIVAVAFHIE